MLASKSEVFDECATTLAELTEDEKIRMQCEARNDYIAREKGLIRRLTEQVRAEVREELTEQVTKQVTEQVTKEVTEQVTEQVTKEVTEMKLIEQICKKLRKGKEWGVIADELEEDVQPVTRICRIAEKQQVE